MIISPSPTVLSATMSTVELSSTCLGGTSKVQPSSPPRLPPMGAPRTFFPNSSTVSWRPGHGAYSAPNTPTAPAFTIENEQHLAGFPSSTLRVPGHSTLRPLSEGTINYQTSQSLPRNQSTPGRRGLLSKLKKQLSKNNTRATANTPPTTNDTQLTAEWNARPSRPVLTVQSVSPSSSTSSSPTIPLFADPTASGSSIFVLEDPVMPLVVAQGPSRSRPAVTSSPPSTSGPSLQQSSHINVGRCSLAISEISQNLPAVPDYPPPIPPFIVGHSQSGNSPNKNTKREKGRKKKNREGRPGSLKSGVSFWSSEESGASSPSSYSCASAARQREDEALASAELLADAGVQGAEKRKSLGSLKGSPSLQSGVSIIGSSKSFFEGLESRRSSSEREISGDSLVYLGGNAEEPLVYAPFVPLIFQHERTQTKSKTSLPLASFEANPEAKSIKSVRVGPHSSSGRPVPYRSKSTDLESTNSEAASSNRPRSRKQSRLSPIPPLPASSPSQLSLSPSETKTNNSGSGGSSSARRRKQRQIPPPLHPAPKSALPPSPPTSSGEAVILEPQSASYGPSSPTGTATSTSTSSEGTNPPVTPSSPLFGVSASPPPDGIDLRISLSSPEEATTGDEMALFGLRSATKRVRTVKSKPSGNLKERRDEERQRGRGRGAADSDAYDSAGGIALQPPFSHSLNVQFAEPLSGRHADSVSRSPSRARSSTSVVTPQPSSSPGRSILSARPSKLNLHADLASPPTSPPPSGPLPSTPGESELHLPLSRNSELHTITPRMSPESPAHRPPSPVPDDFAPLGVTPNPSTLPSASASLAPSPVPRVRDWKEIDLGLISSDSASEAENILSSPSPVVPPEYLHHTHETQSYDDGPFEDNDDAASLVSRPYSYSQSIESHSNDPEYEALLAANTLANANASGMPIRNLGVGRRTVASEAGLTTRGAEWTLFLGNEQKESGGAASALTLRGRTKSESALKGSGVDDLKAPGPRTGRSGSISNPSPRSLHTNNSALTNTSKSTKALKPEALRPTSMIPSDDWTLSLPLQLPGPKAVRKCASSSENPSNLPADHAKNTGGKGVNSVATNAGAEVILLVEGVEIEPEEEGFFDEIEADGSSLGHDVDTEDSTSANDHDSLSDPRLSYASGYMPVSHIILPVPRVVSSGSGLENASRTTEDNPRKWKGRKLSDGMDSIIGATGDAESLLWDSRSMRSTETLLEEDESQGHEEMFEGGQINETFTDSPSSNGAYNMARLNVLSADLRKFNDLLRDGAGTMKKQSSATYLGASSSRIVNLKHAKSCGMLPHDFDTSSSIPLTTAKSSSYQRLQEAAILERSRNTTVTTSEMRADLPPRASTSSPTSTNPNVSSSPPSSRHKVPLPYAPGSWNQPHQIASKPLGRPTSLSISSNVSVDAASIHPPPSAFGRTMGRTLSMTSSVKSAVHKSSLPSTTTSNSILSSIVPDQVVGSGLRVGGNGRVISLKKPASSSQSKAAMLPPLKIVAPPPHAVEPTQDVGHSELENGLQSGQEIVLETGCVSLASSPSSAQTFYTSFSSPSQRPHSPSSTWSNGDSEETMNIQRLSDSPANLRSSASIPTAISPPVLTLLTSPSIHDHQGVSPCESDLYSPMYDTPTPLASSFPTPPPLPSTFNENLSIIRDHRWSTSSRMSQMTATPVRAMTSARPSLSEFDSDSMWSGSFHSARSSFET